MSKVKRYSPEVRERAVRMLFEHEKDYESRWAALVSIASKIGCTAETLRSWVKQIEIDTGRRDGMSSDDRTRLKALEKENKELRRANEILKTASAFFAAAELDRKLK
jgi:transposase-like protein